MSGFVFKERGQGGECVPGILNWFGELWGLSGWYEGKCRGIRCNGVAYKENKPTKEIRTKQ